MQDQTFIPVILCGGRGTRLWPLSRNLYAKQIIPLIDKKSLFQATIDRVCHQSPADIIAVCSEEGRFVIADQMDVLGVKDARIVVEPSMGGTVAAVASAALLARQQDETAVLAILPSDHQIGNQDMFTQVMGQACRLAERGHIVVLGAPPSGPETGYGYIEQGNKISGDDHGYGVARFVEKPSQEEAQALLSTGKAHWNAGIFVATAETLVREMKQHCPDVLQACEAAVDRSKSDLHFLRLDAEAYEAIAPSSFDVAVMERTDKAAVLPVDMAWSDLGSWDCLWKVGDKDTAGNVAIGDVLLRDVKNSYVRSQGRLVVGLGLEDVAVIETGDAVLVTSREKSQDVKHLVDDIQSMGREEIKSHVRVDRPWGFYKILDEGPAHKCKLIGVKPGKRLSLQKHLHRSEHWVVVRGEARVERDGQVRILHPNQSTYLPVGCRHRLENRGENLLLIIEVQTGDYLGEDDIVRFEDDFGRP